MTNFTFTATDGKRYRVTGIGVPCDAVGARHFVPASTSLDDMEFEKVNVWPWEDYQPLTQTQRILVEPVKPVYEVTVRLTGAQVKRLQSMHPGERTKLENDLLDALSEHNYKEVSE